ncbi:hypothetical protein JHN59_38180 [Streptomyces sp. MBT49]|uniref:hypothetical protein n=1 Tax=Streptomyces sp. MBT49 TaxID=1488380 RepID=UPI00190C1E68|nr:hypothetical protein [Streptomyces sp. MBT49]MBK3630528.1 hypothetical protein [Streptomyces sp. MBT49]
MDQGDAAVWAAGISIIGTTIGAVGGYLAGRAQGKATVDGVRLQLVGQRTDTLWQAELDAVAAYIDQLHHSGIQLAVLMSRLSNTPTELRQLAPSDPGASLREAMQELDASITSCYAKMVSLGLRTSPENAASGEAVFQKLYLALSPIEQWVGALGTESDPTAYRQEAEERSRVFSAAMNSFIRDTQARLSQPRPA